jgi:hypothetical protein
VHRTDWKSHSLQVKQEVILSLDCLTGWIEPQSHTLIPVSAEREDKLVDWLVARLVLPLSPRPLLVYSRRVLKRV